MEERKENRVTTGANIMSNTNNNFRTNEERKTPFGTNGAAITAGAGVLRNIDEN